MTDHHGLLGLLGLLIGPSGVGKTVIMHRLQKRHPEWHFAKSATDRPRRRGDAQDFYRFLSPRAFDDLLRRQSFLEWATVHGTARYGTLTEEILPFLEKGEIVLREIDIQGLQSISRHPLFRRPDGTYPYRAIFIAPESAEQLIAHIHKRSPMGKEELQRRLESAREEMAHASQCDRVIVSHEGKLHTVISAMEHAISQRVVN